MTLTGPTRHVTTLHGKLYFGRVEGFVDDRFRLMFCFEDARKTPLANIPVIFKKGTKKVDLSLIWPEVEKELTK